MNEIYQILANAAKEDIRGMKQISLFFGMLFLIFGQLMPITGILYFWIGMSLVDSKNHEMSYITVIYSSWFLWKFELFGFVFAISFLIIGIFLVGKYDALLKNNDLTERCVFTFGEWFFYAFFPFTVAFDSLIEIGSLDGYWLIYEEVVCAAMFIALAFHVFWVCIDFFNSLLMKDYVTPIIQKYSK
jgi:hypothetical protein